MIKFGPSGFCDEFLKQHQHSAEMPEWLESHGLDAYEYSFSKGIHLSDDKAKELCELFASRGIEVSVHGPYYINLATPDEEMATKSKMYIIASLQKMKLLGAKKLVVHPGSLTKQPRDVAFALVLKRLKELSALLDEYGLKDVFVCLETMGKHGQIGTVEEVAKMCAIDERYIPTLDFGHINAYTQGSLKTEKDFAEVFETLRKYMGERYKNVHIHFSPVMYGEKGELKHLNIEEDHEYGPDFSLLSPVLKKLGISGSVISESRDHQTKDALIMKNIFKKD